MPIILSAPAKRRKNAPKKGKKEEAQFWRQVEREEAGFVTKAPAKRKNPSRGYVCVSDRYCPTGDEFSSLADFQRMCVAVFGERARLKASGGNYVDEHGEVVLRPVTAAKKAPAKRKNVRAKTSSRSDKVEARVVEALRGGLILHFSSARGDGTVGPYHTAVGPKRYAFIRYGRVPMEHYGTMQEIAGTFVSEAGVGNAIEALKGTGKYVNLDTPLSVAAPRLVPVTRKNAPKKGKKETEEQYWLRILRGLEAMPAAPAKRKNGSRSVVDTVAARELELYIENERNLVGPGNSMGANIMRMLAGRIVRGTYDSTKAWKAWVPLVTEGAKRYKREHGAINASKATRDAVATRLSEAFEAEVRAGAIDPMKLLGARTNRGTLSVAQGNQMPQTRRNPSGREIVPPLAQWQKGDYEYSVRGRKGHGNTEYVIRNFSPTGSAWVALAVTNGHVSVVYTGITGTHFVGTTPEAVAREYSSYKYATPGAARAALVKAVDHSILPHARSSRR